MGCIWCRMKAKKGKNDVENRKIDPQRHFYSRFPEKSQGLGKKSQGLGLFFNVG